MRGRGQSGASLVVVLAFMVFVSILVPAIISMAMVGLAVRASASEESRESYAAASGIEAATHLLVSEDSGAANECDRTSLIVDGMTVLVDCAEQEVPQGNCREDDRFVALNAVVRSHDGSEDLASVAATVVVPASGEDAGSAVVTRWANGVDGPLPAEAVPCGTATTSTTSVPVVTTTTTTIPAASTTTTSAPVTTTTTSTTSTTSTTIPEPMVRSWWQQASSELRSGNKKWRAAGVVKVSDQLGEPVEKVRVTVSVMYRDSSGWHSDKSKTASTGSDGTASIYSKSYRRTGSTAVIEVRLTISSVEAPSGVPWDADAFAVDAYLDAP